jgi:hypothetical protein
LLVQERGGFAEELRFLPQEPGGSFEELGKLVRGSGGFFEESDGFVGEPAGFGQERQFRGWSIGWDGMLTKHRTALQAMRLLFWGPLAPSRALRLCLPEGPRVRERPRAPLQRATMFASRRRKLHAGARALPRKSAAPKTLPSVRDRKRKRARSPAG